MTMTKRLWSLNALATELDHDRRTIAGALKSVPQDGELAGHPAWFIGTALKALRPQGSDDDALDPAQERARKDRALAIAAEIRNDLATGKVVLADFAITAVNIQTRKLRNKLLALPMRIATRVPDKVRAEVFALAETEIHAAMAELSSGGEAHVTQAEVEAEIERTEGGTEDAA